MLPVVIQYVAEILDVKTLYNGSSHELVVFGTLHKGSETAYFLYDRPAEKE